MKVTVGTPDADHPNKPLPPTRPPFCILEVEQSEVSWRRDKEPLTQNQIQFQPNGRHGRHTGRLHRSCQDTSMTGRQTAVAATRRDAQATVTQTVGHKDTRRDSPQDRQTLKCKDRQTDRHQDKQILGRRDSRTDSSQADRHTDRQQHRRDTQTSGQTEDR